MNCFVPLYAATAHNLSQGANTHPLPRIGDVKRYLIRQRPHFIADFLIRSIIRTRLFNDYLGSLTNTPVIQRLSRQFNDYNATESCNPPKTHKTPPQKRSVTGFVICLNSRKALFQAVFGRRKSPLHIARVSGHRCVAQRPDCAPSGHPIIEAFC